MTQAYVTEVTGLAELQPFRPGKKNLFFQFFLLYHFLNKACYFLIIHIVTHQCIQTTALLLMHELNLPFTIFRNSPKLPTFTISQIIQE